MRTISQMNFDQTQLNSLLGTFVDVSTDGALATRTGRQLTALSERAGFIENAMDLLIHYQLSANKLTLLSCMVKDQFKYCFELVDTARINDYYKGLQDIALRTGVQHRGLYLNVAESLAIIYINAAGITEYPLMDYLEFFTSSHNINLCYYYFKILEYCASGIENSRLVLEHSNRQAARQRLIDQQNYMVGVLNDNALALADTPHLNKMPIIECLDRWVRLQYNRELFRELPQLYLFRLVVEAVDEAQYADCAIECLLSVVRMVKAPEENENLYTFFMQLVVFKLMPMVDKLIAEREQLTSAELIKLMAEFGRVFAPLMLKQFSSQLWLAFFNPLLHYFFNKLEGTIEPLIEFSEALLTEATRLAASDNLNPEFGNVPFVMLMGLVQVCEYSPELIKQLETYPEHKLSSSSAEGELVYRYRIKAGTLVEMIAEVVGVEPFLDFLVGELGKLSPGKKEFWGGMESVLYCLHEPLASLPALSQKAANLVSSYEQEICQELYGSVPVLIKRTFLRLFRSLFSVPGKPLDLIRRLLYFTTSCFDQPLLFTTAQRTYYHGCLENASVMATYLDQLYTLILRHPTEEDIARAYICVACADPANAHINVYKGLDRLLTSLKDIQRGRKEKKDMLVSLTAAINELRDFHFDLKHEVVISFTWQAWSFITDALQNPRSKNEDEDSSIERVVKLLKSIMRLLKTDFAEFLSQLFVLVNQKFAEYPICSYLYLLEITVTVFSHVPESHLYLSRIYQDFCTSAFSHLSSPQALEKFGYLVDDFLGMNTRLLLYSSAIIIESKQFPRLLAFVSGDCLLTTAPKPVKATYSFLQTLFMVFWSQQQRQEYNREEECEGGEVGARWGQQDIRAPFMADQEDYLRLKTYLLSQMGTIISHMVQHLNFRPVQMTRECIIEAIESQIKAFPAENPDLWREAICQLPPDVFLQEEKAEFMGLLERLRGLKTRGQAMGEGLKEIYGRVQLMDRRMSTSEKRRQLKLAFK